jgi:hypothetical protein
MTTSPLVLTRSQILAFRRTMSFLDRRQPLGAAALRGAAWAGLQDSMPRAALLSIHARMDGTEPTSWEDPALVQVWGPRFSAYVVPAEDRAVFTLGRLPDGGPRLRRALDTADRLEAFLGDRRLPYGEAGRGLGVSPNSLRYAAPTGRVLIRWDGARQPTIWMVPAPHMDPRDARAEMARRFLRVLGPGTPASFATWAGIRSPGGQVAFDALGAELTAVRTPLGDAWILAADEPVIRFPAPTDSGAARLLPSGDTWFLMQGRDRELLVPDAKLRPLLWTTRVWPGAVLIGHEIVGVWRRAERTVAIQPWRRLDAAERRAVEEEAASLPLPDLAGSIRTRWDP